MSELAILALFVTGVAVFGVALGLMLAPRIDRLTEDNEEDRFDDGAA